MSGLRRRAKKKFPDRGRQLGGGEKRTSDREDGVVRGRAERWPQFLLKDRAGGRKYFYLGGKKTYPKRGKGVGMDEKRKMRIHSE